MQGHTELNENLTELLAANNNMISLNLIPIAAPKPPQRPFNLSLSTLAVFYISTIAFSTVWFLSEETEERLRNDILFPIVPLVKVADALFAFMALNMSRIYLNESIHYTPNFFQPTPEVNQLPTPEELETITKNQELLQDKLEEMEKYFSSITDEAKAKFIAANLVDSEDCNALKFICAIKRSLICLPVKLHLQGGQEKIYEYSMAMEHIKTMLSRNQIAMDPETRIKITGYSISPQLIEEHGNYLLELEHTIAELENSNVVNMNSESAGEDHEDQSISQLTHRHTFS